MISILSSEDDLQELAKTMYNYIRLPVATDAIPGAFLESVLAHVRNGEVLPTYDYIDVIDRDNRLGWSIKSTKQTTPVTWKRAKLADQQSLIATSKQGGSGLQALGDAIINFCNEHARESIEKYNLTEIGYSRLILKQNKEIMYFERRLCDQDDPRIFKAEDFEWKWSQPKNTQKKEQLPALHGFHRMTGKKWWAWHGLGENQLHFSGEKEWWPSDGSNHAICFKFPSEAEKLSFDKLAALLEAL